MPDHPILEARGLVVAPPGGVEPLLRDLTLSIDRGDWLAITGANGAGKSTLALTLAGLLPAHAGELLLDGAPFGPHVPAERRCAVSVILQDPTNQLLQPTVLDEVAFAVRNLGCHDPESAARRALGAFDLDALSGRDPRTLSAGQQQKVLLAAALATAPGLLVADEPFAHLDAGARMQAHAILEQARARGLALVSTGETPAATCQLALDGPPAPLRPAAPRVRGDVGPACVLEVQPMVEGVAGPRVDTPRPLAIPIGSRGVTALLGRNGAGKSVLLSAASGVVTLPQVKVRWVIAPDFPPIHVSQHPDEQLFEERAGDELIYAAEARGVPRDRARALAAEALERAGLPKETVSRRTWTLSGGEKRIVVTLAALIAPAGLVTLDEPTAGLDAARRAAVGEAISRVSSEVPVLMATQDRGFAVDLGAALFELP